MVWFSWLYLFFLLVSSSNGRSSTVLSNLSSSPPFPLCHVEECSALLQFKRSFSSNDNFLYSDDHCGRPETDSWENGIDCCQWSGIMCHRMTGHVISLNLSCSGLQGQLHSNSSLFLLGHLQSIILSENDFRGSPIPSEFGKFKNLVHFKIIDSNFSGHVPLEISYLSKLVTLHVFSYSTTELVLEVSTFRRIARNLTNLKELELFQVNMSSVEPVLLSNLSSSLQSLVLQNCGLRGKILDNIFRQRNLKVLDLEGNMNLVGSLPRSNWSSSPIESLDLSGTKFSLDLPHLSKTLKSLKSLYLSSCTILGWNAKLLSNFTELISLDLSLNNLGGQIPWSSFNLYRLTDINFWGNNCTGQLPELESWNSTRSSSSPYSSNKNSADVIPFSLSFIELQDNLLNGTIPHWLYSLPFLQYLILSDNQFTGYIHEFQSRGLKFLILNNNKLQGSIPRSIFQLENLNILDLSSNNLSGVVGLYEFSKLKNLVSLDLSFNYNLTLSSEVFLNHTLPSLSLLYLPSCNIKEFPNFMRGSKQLQRLDLSNNQIDGNIPKWLWDVGKDSLKLLNLSHNFLAQVQQFPWTQLQYLDLHSNLLQGHLLIPSPSTIFFSVSSNQLSGEIPSSICNLNSLKVFDLSNNSMIGKIPSCIGNFSAQLSVLNLGMNKLQGVIATTFGKGSFLRNLNLNSNQLEGSLPRSLLNCKQLEILDLGNNKLNGTFPSWLESLPELQVLILRANRLHGLIGSPKARRPFQRLRILDLSCNEFQGKLPTKYFENMIAIMDVHYTEKVEYMGEMYYYDSVIVVVKGFQIDFVKIQTIFTTIDFSKNSFEGEIPELIGNLKSLKGLNFSHNKLSGCIPWSLRNLSNLEWLDLSSNELVGEIPQQLKEMTSLAVLNLSENRLIGPIPQGNQFDTFDSGSYCGNLGLCGFPLSKTCNKDEIEPFSPTMNFQQYSSDSIIEKLGLNTWKIVLMGYACGMVFGISMGYLKVFDRQLDWFITKIVVRWRRMMSWKFGN